MLAWVNRFIPTLVVHEGGTRGSGLAVSGMREATVDVPCARVRRVVVEVQCDTTAGTAATGIATGVGVATDGLDVTVALKPPN